MATQTESKGYTPKQWQRLIGLLRAGKAAIEGKTPEQVVAWLKKTHGMEIDVWYVSEAMNAIGLDGTMRGQIRTINQ